MHVRERAVFVNAKMRDIWNQMHWHVLYEKSSYGKQERQYVTSHMPYPQSAFTVLVHFINTHFSNSLPLQSTHSVLNCESPGILFYIHV